MPPRSKRGRLLDGVLLLDKPLDVTSNHVLQKVKRLYNAAKAGHTGSLDPLATGMLPICFGEATKFSQYLLNSDKSYAVTAELGVTTTTGDTAGDVVKVVEGIHVSLEKLTEVLDSFLGESQQVPSMYSALKQQGKPLYELARQGITVERDARSIHIKQIQLQSYDGKHFSFSVLCSKGTYVRSLVEDIGAVLGCGAHVTRLHRETVSHFKASEMVSFSHIMSLRDEKAFAEMDALLLPVDTMMVHWPKVVLTSHLLHYFLQGQAIMLEKLTTGDNYRVYDEEGQFRGIGEVDEHAMLAPKRLVSTG